MAKLKACKSCKIIVESGTTCPLCKGTQLIDSWKGKAIIINPEKSEIAQKLAVKQKGTYALKIR
ncbi:MAG: DNA-directed RNA polymerase subunit E'' [Candidatus Pacearchaeota archaeon]|nr:DNA-directed RNA polymerase subunit E'' [Candidatus Pacearchaeota archaeon]